MLFGTYHVTFRVVDKNGAITEKTITVTVKEKATNKPVSYTHLADQGPMLVF